MNQLPDARDADYKPDMTPMIDVVFLMIIFFLCLDFRVLESKLPAFLPKDHGGHATVAPKEQLVVQVLESVRGRKVPDPARPDRHRIEGRQVRWRVGPNMVHTFAELEAELARVAASPGGWTVAPDTGERERIPCLIEPMKGICYADVATTTDVVASLGFDEITFGGGRR
ncbi:MAG: biopolymer transporter ExbD [bacterium]|nr:biopolymer transporter ExbD [bacterium]